MKNIASEIISELNKHKGEILKKKSNLQNEIMKL